MTKTKSPRFFVCSPVTPSQLIEMFMIVAISQIMRKYLASIPSSNGWVVKIAIRLLSAAMMIAATAAMVVVVIVAFKMVLSPSTINPWLRAIKIISTRIIMIFLTTFMTTPLVGGFEKILMCVLII